MCGKWSVFKKLTLGYNRCSFHVQLISCLIKSLPGVCSDSITPIGPTWMGVGSYRELFVTALYRLSGTIALGTPP
jgi:hypothetical protein